MPLLPRAWAEPLGTWGAWQKTTGSSTSGSPASSRTSSQSGFRVQAQSNNTPRPFSWGLNPVSLPQSQSSRASSSSGRSLIFSYPAVHTQHVPNSVAERNVTVARAFTKLMGAFVTFWDNDPLAGQPGAGRGPHRRGQAGGQPPGVSDAAGQPAVPSQPHEGSLGALPSLRVLTTTRCATSTSAAWATCATASLLAFPPSACPRCR